jgi:hypothetical protein
MLFQIGFQKLSPMLGRVLDMRAKKTLVFAVFFLIGVAGHLQLSHAGVFNIPHFITPDEFAIGFEPELSLGDEAGLGFNIKYTHGLGDLVNAQAIIGTSGGSRKFRAGGNLVFDFFPDIEGQPGIGIALQSVYYRLKESSQDKGQLELTAIPYIHKAFVLPQGSEVEPFFSLPIGAGFSSGRYRAISTVTVGALFKNNEHIRYTLELGVAVNNTDSYVSGGFTYYH